MVDIYEECHAMNIFFLLSNGHRRLKQHKRNTHDNFTNEVIVLKV